MQDGRSFPSIILKKHHLSKSELVAGIGVRFMSHDGEGFPSAIATGPKKHHKSELVVGIGTQSNSAQQHNYNLVNSIKTDIKEFASIFTKPHSTQPPYTGVTLQHYPSFNGIWYFTEPVIDQNFQHYQNYHTEDTGVIFLPNFNTPSSDINGSGVLDIDKRVRLATRGEVVEYLPSHDTYKVGTSLCIMNYMFLSTICSCSTNMALMLQHLYLLHIKYKLVQLIHMCTVLMTLVHMFV